MMAVIVIDGPEKAGKTTLINEIHASLISTRQSSCIVRKQSGRALPNESVYLDDLLKDASVSASVKIVIWDRSWASEYVYGTLLNQNRPMVKDPLSGEWLLGKIVVANGIRLILPGPDPTILSVRRDSTDLSVDPAKEQMLYKSYGKKFGWMELREIRDVETTVHNVLRLFYNSIPMYTPLPPYYYGKADAGTIVISSKNRDKIIKEQWQENALKVGWVIAHGCPPQALRHARRLVVYDSKSYLWAKNYILQTEGGCTRQEIVSLIGSEYANINQVISQIDKGY